MKRSKAPFWLVGYTLFIVMTGTNLPSPLYGVYKAMWGFSAGTLTLVFAVYALAIIPSLLLFGQLSDRFGRKTALLPGLLAAVAGSALFACAHDVRWLLLARAVQGLAVGIVSGAASAALAELHPHGDRRQAALAASVAPAAGTALGTMLAAVLAEYSPWPTTLPFIVHIAAAAPCVLGLALLPETVDTSARKAWKLRRPGVPKHIRAPFLVASATAFITWAVTALFMSLVPSYMADLLHVRNVAVTGGAVVAMLVASSAAQLAFRRLDSRAAQTAGLVLLVLGLAGVVLAVPLLSAALLFAAALLAGAGQGLAFMGSMALVNAAAPQDRRGDVLSSFYVVIYSGVGLPILAIGYGAQTIGLYRAVAIFAGVIAVLGLALALAIGKRTAQTAAPPPATRPSREK